MSEEIEKTPEELLAEKLQPVLDGIKALADEHKVQIHGNITVDEKTTAFVFPPL